METDFATHVAPVWRDKANYLIAAELADYDMPGRWEQLWARQTADGEFELCCLPYFTYGLALGDIVRTRSTDAVKHVIAQVQKRSGRRLLRLWLKNAELSGKERVYAYLAKHSPLHEWSSEHLLAIDVPADDSIASQYVLELLEDIKNAGIDVEWGN